MGCSSDGETMLGSNAMSKDSPTKEQRVFISSRTASERTSNGTRVGCEETGVLMAVLRDVGGGTYVPKRSKSARR